MARTKKSPAGAPPDVAASLARIMTWLQEHATDIAADVVSGPGPAEDIARLEAIAAQLPEGRRTELRAKVGARAYDAARRNRIMTPC